MGIALTSYPVMLAQNLTLQSDAGQIKTYIRSAQGFSTSSVEHHSEMHIIKTTVMKQSKELNGDLKSEYNKTKNRTTTSPATDIDIQTLAILNRLSRS